MARTINMKVIDGAFEDQLLKEGIPQFDADGQPLTRKTDLHYLEEIKKLLRAEPADDELSSDQHGRPHGIKPAAMMDRLKVWQAIDKAEDRDVVVLEDDVYALLVEHVNRFSWLGFNPHYGQFLHDVLNAPTYDLPRIVAKTDELAGGAIEG